MNTKRKYNIVWILSLFCAFTSLHAQMTLVKDGKPQSRIVVADKNDVNMQAADLLQDFVKRITSTQLPIVVSDKEKKGDVVIGKGSVEGLTEDGFRLSSADGSLFVSSGGDKGCIYGIVTLLEDYLGVNYYTSHTCTYEKKSTLVLPEINRAENPAFRYRQTQSYAIAEDPIYKMWFRLEEPKEVFANGLWVHTFDKILPSSEFGDSHPEYYSFINGERRPGAASQWCLTNPEVFELVSHRVDSIFKANPGMNMISISQNDGNFTNCACDKCKALDEQEGGVPSGSLIHFLNKLAARFPDKEFSTLAYLFTMHPPKHVKPLPNVNIMLCDIDCKREVPLTDNVSGQDFMKAMEGWSKISNNIFIWDYGINFDCYLSPFPNFPILQKNMKLFKDHHVTMHFSQIAGSKCGTFTEMRAYIVSKLMWNPDQDVDVLMKKFMKGYYGAAAPYLYQYEKLLEGALLGSGIDLWIFDSPVSHKRGMLNLHCIKRYNELFDQAEAAVADNQELLDRVRTERLTLQYSELEVARSMKGQNVDEIKQKLELFRERAAYYKLPTINERNNSPLEYCDLYEKRFLPKTEKNYATGAKITWVKAPTGRYKEHAEEWLLDELYGGTAFVESWIGWEGTDAEFILDLGKEVNISVIESDFLHQLGQWVFLPKQVTYSVSTDNQQYKTFGTTDIAEDKSIEVKFFQARSQVEQPQKARYVKVEIKGVNTCPSWHCGVGHKAWFFMDEIRVL